MKINQKTRRFTTLCAAGLVALLSASVVTRATQIISTPNASLYGYSLAAGASTGAIVVPAANQAVLMMGTQTTVGYRGVASATVLRVPSSFIEWVGLESTSGAAITQGFSGSANVHILYLDFSHQVDVRVAGTDTVLIHNGATAARTGNLTFIW